jgi:hypothetical protein
MPISRNYVQNTPSCPVRLCYHEIFRLMLMERQAQLQQQDDMTMSERIDLLDAAYRPQQAIDHK